MISRRTILMLTLCFLATVPCAKAQEQSLDDLFPRDRVLTIDITIDEDDWDEIRHQTRSFADVLQPSRQFEPIDSPYTYVEANVTIDGVNYPKVGLRKKGFIGSLDDERPSLKIKLDKFDKDATIGGLGTLTLNNNKQDRSLMSQFMGYSIFNAAGSPAPRCAYAKVTVNGNNLGIYSHVESVRDPLLKREFGNDKGTLYEGSVVDFYEDWDQSFERKLGKDKSGRKQINQLIDALEDEDIDLEEIWSLVDEESFYRFWTVEGLLSFWDGYSGNRNNYFIYLNPETQKFHFMPWGADCMFEKYSQLGEDRNSPRSVRMQGLLANRLYQLPEVRARYAQTMKELIAKQWDEDRLLAETERIEEMVAPHLSRRQKRATNFNSIRSFIRNRRNDVEPEIYGKDMPQWSHIPEEPPVIGGIVWKKGTLATAAKDGDIASVQKYLDNGANVNRPSRDTGSVLGVAAFAGQLEVMKLLIEHGADVNIANGDGNTPLHGSAFFGEVDAVKVLLDAGANPNPRNNNGETPMDSSGAPWGAEIKGVVEFIARLVNIEVDLEEVKAGRPQAVKILREHGGKFGSELPRQEGGGIWGAAKSGDLKTLQKYLDDGTDPNQRDDKSITPLCWAAMAGQKDAAILLIENGADLNATNGDGATPLHGAAFFGKGEIVDLLIEKGADVQARNNEGRTALDTIAEGWSPQMQEVVIWIGNFLELEIDPQKIKAAWPGIARTLRTNGS